MNKNRFPCLYLIASLLLASLAFADTDTRIDNPFEQAPYTTVKKETLFRSDVLTLSDGDYVHPRFSPDARYLVYADVLTRKDSTNQSSEGTAVYVLDLVEGTTATLLSEADADKYRVYKVYVSDIMWKDSKHVEVSLSDGDVGTVLVTFDISSGTAVSMEDVEPGEDDFERVPSQFLKLRSEILSTFPKWTAVVLDSTLRSNAIKVSDGGVILQRNYSGFDHHILYLDIETKKQTRILKMGEEDLYTLGGGVSVNGETLFTVTSGSYFYLFRLENSGESRPLARYTKTQWRPSIDVRSKTENKAMFILHLGESYQIGHNPVLNYSKSGGLVELEDCTDCYDFDVSPEGDIAAFLSWKNDRRQLIVRRTSNK